MNEENIAENENINLNNNLNNIQKNHGTMLSNMSRIKIQEIYSKKLIGYILLLFVIIINVVSAIWIKFIIGNVKPFCLTYINYCFLIILIFVSVIKKKIVECYNNRDKKLLEDMEDLNLSEKVLDDTYSDTFAKVMIDNKHEYENKFHYLCIILMLFWYFGNAFYNLGLSITSVTSTNTLSTTTILFILIEKAIFFKSKCSVFKIVGLILCTAGVMLMGFFESSTGEESKENSIWGDVFIIIGAFAYSIYAILIKYYSKKHKHYFDMMDIFGYMGLYNLLIIPFILILINLAGFEDIIIPSWTDVGYIFINAVVSGLIADLCQSYCITLLPAHIVSFGLTLTIPLSYFYDFFSGNIVFNLFYMFGSILIFAAFCVILTENYLKYVKKKNNLENSGLKKTDFL